MMVPRKKVGRFSKMRPRELGKVTQQVARQEHEGQAAQDHVDDRVVGDALGVGKVDDDQHRRDADQRQDVERGQHAFFKAHAVAFLSFSRLL